MEICIGCRSELRHSHDSSMQSGTFLPNSWSCRWGRHCGAGIWTNRPWLPLVPFPVTFTTALQKRWSRLLPQHQTPFLKYSTSHSGPKYLSTSHLPHWAPSFLYPLLKPQLLTQCLAHHRPGELSVFKRRYQIWTQELFFGRLFCFRFPASFT